MTPTVRQSFLQPMIDLLPECETTRAYPALPDLLWLELCLERVLHESRSGRGFLQEHGVRWAECPGVGAFFETLKFLTTEMTLAPGGIAHLYRLRWEIEKVFDVFKNKLVEKKAWASSATAKCLHSLHAPTQ